MKNIVDRQFQLLEKELELVDAAIRQLDEITKSIKNWGIVTWTAAVGVALASNDLKSFVWMTGFIPLLFWLVDGTYRRVQRSFILRNKQIGVFLNSDQFVMCVGQTEPMKFALLKMRVKSRKWRDTLFGVMLFKTVAVLYVGLASLSILAWHVSN